MTVASSPIAPQNKNGAPQASFLARPRVPRRLAVLLILWLALFLRVWQLDTLPPGLHYDEAFNGTMARDVLRGVNRPIFFTPNFGEEPLHIYTEAVLFALVGESPWTIRLVSALFGVVFVTAMYACARAFFPRSDLLPPVAAFLAATLYWAINFSRIGIETNGLPMLLTLSAAALAQAYRKMSWHWIVAAGFLIGATLYTYLASRLWLAAIALWLIYLFVFHRTRVREHFSKWIIVGAITLLTLTPLILFFVANPVAFTGRSGTVFTPEIVLTNLARTAGMFFVSGDLDPRDNLPARPALDLLLALFFLVGLGVSLVRFRKPFYALVLIWLVVMCLPSALTEFAPNFRRAIGAMPATILLCAIGIEWIWLNAKFKIQNSEVELGWVVRAVLLAGLGISAFWSARAYFVEWASGTGLYYSFDAGLLQVGRALVARPQDEPLYLTPDYAEHYTIIWALDGRNVASFDGRRGLVLADSSRAATYGIIAREDRDTLDALKHSGISITPVQSFRDEANQPYAELIRADSIPRSENAARVRADDFADLLSATVAPADLGRGTSLQVSLEWFALRRAEKDYTVSVQLTGPPNPGTNSRVWAQRDTQPIGGTYATTEWQTGERILETYTMTIPREAVNGEYALQVNLYELGTGGRVPLYTPDGTRIENDALIFFEFRLR